MMSIKNNYKSKFSSVYLSTKEKFFVNGSLLIFVFSGFSLKLIAQIVSKTMLLVPEGNSEELSQYNGLKSFFI